MSKINCFVVGKLGEVVKKIYELEELLRKNPGNAILVAELVQYQKILEVWPIEDPFDVHMVISSFKVSLAKYQECSKELKECIDPEKRGPWSYVTISHYIQAKEQCQAHLKLLNDLGKCIGPSPWVELNDDIQMERTSDIA